MTTKAFPTAPVLAADVSAAELNDALQVQRTSYLAEGVPSLETRLNRVDRFTLAILENAEAFAEALSADFGNRPAFASLATDLITLTAEVEELHAKLPEWMRDRQVAGSAEAGLPTYVQVRPKGVVGVIGPWNFPILLVAAPTIEALGAGNRVMIKVSEVPSRTADLLAEAVARRMSPDEVVVVRGGVTTSAAFSSLALDHLIFTGSPQVGSHVGAAAGANLVPTTLELGGKNPVVVADDASIEESAWRVATMRHFNGGQVCLCPDYVFVPTAKKSEFIAAYQKTITEVLPDYPVHNSVVSIIDDRNYERVLGLVNDAKEKGAQVLHAIPENEVAELPDSKTRRIIPSIIVNATDDMDITHEEIFGPVIVLYTYDKLEEVINHINGRPSPLAAYWFGSDSPQFQQFLKYTTSGGVTRNDLGSHWSVPGAPSGGIGRSGMGAYSGKSGFDTFSHLRTVTASEQPEGLAAGILLGGDAELAGSRAYIEQSRTTLETRVG